MTKIILHFTSFPQLSYFLGTLANTQNFKATIQASPIILTLTMPQEYKNFISAMAAATGATTITFEEP